MNRGTTRLAGLLLIFLLCRSETVIGQGLYIPSGGPVNRSMGGAIAQHMALLAPDRVHSLILASSFAKFDPVWTRVLSNMREILEWRDNWTDWARHSTWAFFSPKSYNENPDAVANMQAIIGDETRSKISYINLNKACLDHDTLDRLGEITCPTLIMAGAVDPVCSLTAAGWMQDSIPHAETVIFENSSHFFLMEEAEKAMSTIADWLQRHTP